MKIFKINSVEFSENFETTMFRASKKVRKELIKILRKLPDGMITLEQILENLKDEEFDFIDSMAHGKALYNTLLRECLEGNCSGETQRFLIWMYDVISTDESIKNGKI